MLLQVNDLHVKYGNIEVVHGINLQVGQGEIVTIVGANGAGKSTTLLTISGLVKPSKGTILLEGRPLEKMKAHEIVEAGIAQVPEGRRIFGTLTTEENLNLGAFTRNDQQKIKKNLEWIYGLFPILLERKQQLAGTLSGGEQQMLAIGRGLMSEPKVLLMDEPSLGLGSAAGSSHFQTMQRDQCRGRHRSAGGTKRARRLEAGSSRIRLGSGQDCGRRHGGGPAGRSQGAERVSRRTRARVGQPLSKSSRIRSSLSGAKPCLGS